MILIFGAVLSLLVTVMFMFALRPLAIRTGLVDRPSGRKKHVGEVPIIGGIAMFIGMVFGVWLSIDMTIAFRYMIPAGALLILVGVLDDRYGIPFSIRLSLQTCAALIMILGGGLIISEIGDPFGLGTVHLGPAAVVFSVLVTLSVINAFNFIDGLDGLAGCISFVALLAVACSGGWTEPASIIAVIACGSIIGFLIFNLPFFVNRRLRSFMGDGGSTLLGLLVVWLTISISQGESHQISPIAALWFALIPVSDFFRCLVQRLMKGVSPFRPSREHLHHILLRKGLNTRQTLAFMTGLSALYAAIGLIGNNAGVPDSAMFTLWAVVGVSQYWIMTGSAALIRAGMADRAGRPALPEHNLTALYESEANPNTVPEHTEK